MTKKQYLKLTDCLIGNELTMNNFAHNHTLHIAIEIDTHCDIARNHWLIITVHPLGLITNFNLFCRDTIPLPLHFKYILTKYSSVNVLLIFCSQGAQTELHNLNCYPLENPFGIIPFKMLICPLNLDKCTENGQCAHVFVIYG